MKKIFILTPVYILFFLLGDIFFSNFIYKENINHNCYKYLSGFHHLKKNCHAKEKWLKNIVSYDVYTDGDGYRIPNNKKNNKKNGNIAIFLGGSFTYGMGLKYEKSFVGLIDNKTEKYSIKNLGVAGYSPTVFSYQLDKLIKKNIKSKKIFITLDIIDVSNEAKGWIYNKKFDHPVRLLTKDIQNLNDGKKKETGFKSFKNNNLKATRIIARYINNSLRNLRYNFSQFQLKTKNKIPGKSPGKSGWGDFLYTNIENTNLDHWSPVGFNKTISIIKNEYKKIGKLSKKIDSELYIIIYPWPDTLFFGQEVFNWESFGNELCLLSECNKLISLFPELEKVKAQNTDWLTKLFNENDLHLTSFGQEIIAKKVLKEGFY